MPLRLAGGDQLLPHANRKREIGQPVAMQVPELPPANAKLDAAESMGRGGDTGPPGYFFDDLLLNALSHVHLRALPRHRASRLHGPGPAEEIYSHRKQKSTAGVPILSTGQKPIGAWPMK